jgi:hypothetical protein
MKSTKLVALEKIPTVVVNENKSKKILVHCTNSVSRSIATVLYYLMMS